MPDNKPAVISASFIKGNPIPTRGAYQIICEVADENQLKVLQTLGVPTAAKPIPVAIAALDPDQIGE